MAEIRELIHALGEPTGTVGGVESSQWPPVEHHLGLVVPPKVRGFYETFGASVICANYTILSLADPSVAASSDHRKSRSAISESRVAGGVFFRVVRLVAGPFRGVGGGGGEAVVFA